MFRSTPHRGHSYNIRTLSSGSHVFHYISPSFRLMALSYYILFDELGPRLTVQNFPHTGFASLVGMLCGLLPL